VTVLTLDGDSYREHGHFAPGTTATSALVPQIAVEVAKLFAA
jgi:hypothetical protein